MLNEFYILHVNYNLYHLNFGVRFIKFYSHVCIEFAESSRAHSKADELSKAT